MKKVVAILGVVMIGLVALIVIFLNFLSNQSVNPRNFQEKTEMGGEIEKKYMAKSAFVGQPSEIERNNQYQNVKIELE